MQQGQGRTGYLFHLFEGILLVDTLLFFFFTTKISEFPFSSLRMHWWHIFFFSEEVTASLSVYGETVSEFRMDYWQEENVIKKQKKLGMKMEICYSEHCGCLQRNKEMCLMLRLVFTCWLLLLHFHGAVISDLWFAEIWKNDTSLRLLSGTGRYMYLSESEEADTVQPSQHLFYHDVLQSVFYYQQQLQSDFHIRLKCYT